MKFFDTDWNVILRWLAVWNRLSPAARRHYLLAESGHAAPVAAEGYGTELPLLLESGLVKKLKEAGVFLEFQAHTDARVRSATPPRRAVEFADESKFEADEVEEW